MSRGFELPYLEINGHADANGTLARRKDEKMYKLMVSYDCGGSYSLKLESKDLEELKKQGTNLDKEMLRWYVEGEKGEIVRDVVSAIHKGIIDFFTIMNRRPDEEDYNDEDFEDDYQLYCREICFTNGIWMGVEKSIAYHNMCAERTLNPKLSED